MNMDVTDELGRSSSLQSPTGGQLRQPTRSSPQESATTTATATPMAKIKAEDIPEVPGLVLDEEFNMLLSTSPPQLKSRRNSSSSAAFTSHPPPKKASLVKEEDIFDSSSGELFMRQPSMIAPADPIDPIEHAPPVPAPTAGDETTKEKNARRSPEPATQAPFQSHSQPQSLAQGQGGEQQQEDDDEIDRRARVSAYATLEFDNTVFYVQTLQVVLGRKSQDELIQQNVDVHLSEKKAISRRHAKIFYNFGTQRFEISVLGKNGAFVNESFVEKGITIPLVNGVKIQIGDIKFEFKLPDEPKVDENNEQGGQSGPKQFNPSDAINLKSNLFSKTPTPKNSPNKKMPDLAEVPELQSTSPAQPALSPPPPAAAAVKPKQRKMSRRDSLLKLRRLSKSQGTSDEINELLKGIGLNPIGDGSGAGGVGGGEEPMDLDDQIRLLLDEDASNLGIETSEGKSASLYDESAIADDDAADVAGNVGGGENENDKLGHVVKSFDQADHEIKDLDMQVRHLGQEISQLSSQPQGGDSSLIQEKEMEKKHLEELKKSKELNLQQRRNSYVKNAGPISRATPLMGKPASIQPPASSSIYNRIHGLDRTGFPFHSGGQNPAMFAPPPKLIAPVHIITSEPSAIRPRPPLRAITISDVPTLSTYYYPKTLDEPGKYPKPKKLKKLPPKKTAKRVFNAEEIPEQCRVKPNLTYNAMILEVLKTSVAAQSGLTVNEICESIKEVYPYYKYCPDGWQTNVGHTVKFSKFYKRVAHTGSEPKHVLDELYLDERNAVRQQQKQIAEAKAKAEFMRQEEIRQRQRLEAQQQFNNQMYVNRGVYSQPKFQTPTPAFAAPAAGITPTPTTALGLAPAPVPAPPVALVAPIASNGPLPTAAPPTTKIEPAQNTGNGIGVGIGLGNKNGNAASPSTPVAPPQPSMSDPGTQKSLEYLRKDLFSLYKSRNLSYDRETATSLITKALATTIAQVNSIGAKTGCGDNALAFLVEKAPQQVSKILGIALTKSIREHEGTSSNSSTKPSTPVQARAVPASMPMAPPSAQPVATQAPQATQVPQIQAPQATQATPATQGGLKASSLSPTKEISSAKIQNGQSIPSPQARATTDTSRPGQGISQSQSQPAASAQIPTSTRASPPLPPPTPSSAITQPAVSNASSPTATNPATQNNSNSNNNNFSPTGPSVVAQNNGTSRLPSYGKPPSLGRPSYMGRPPSYGKPPGAGSALSRPPSFLSNKPTFQSGIKRESDSSKQDHEPVSKIPRTSE
ncbi:uncharacterized protein LODBEIA_P25070 [Lodderomyces beijingensis]|uniref:FHA domain-containing protein n=1 Tax=Lodderomyces beijingensis TaxID=1775926 RepID=A0ABP0ZKV7_9ASCO